MPRLSRTERQVRLAHIREQLAAGITNPQEIARRTGLPARWTQHMVKTILHGGLHSYTDQPSSKPLKQIDVHHLIDALRSKPPATLTEAMATFHALGYGYTHTGVRRFLAKHNLPIPQPQRGVGAPPSVYTRLETLRSELRILCMQHPEHIPTSLIEELCHDHEEQ